MSQQRQQYQMGVMDTGENNGGQFVDKTLTKIFVGGLAWETRRESLGKYFEQFGEILEAVVITDKLTGKSKGYGFVISLLVLNFLFFINFTLHIRHDH